MRTRILVAATVLSLATVFLFQNCSTDFGDSNSMKNAATSGQFHWTLVAGQCSTQCGAGTQTPVAVCVDLAGHSVADVYCGTKPIPTPMSCQVQTCGGTYSWVITPTGNCVPTNGTCGAGSQAQTVVCKSSAGAAMPDSWCSASVKPATSVACVAGSCLATPSPNSFFGCNPGNFDHCQITTATHTGTGNITGTCQSGYANVDSSPCYASCNTEATGKGSSTERWTVFSNCGHAGAWTKY